MLAIFLISILLPLPLSLAIGATTEEVHEETPLALPIAEQMQPTTAAISVANSAASSASGSGANILKMAAQGEIWEEDDHEILIRNERGTKNDRK